MVRIASQSAGFSCLGPFLARSVYFEDVERHIRVKLNAVAAVRDWRARVILPGSVPTPAISPLRAK
jgi:hypothetical protein